MSSDRNLLLGILALQMGFVSRDSLIANLSLCGVQKGKSLGAILAEKGELTPKRLDLLELVVDEHVKGHDGDVAQSLASIRSIGLTVSEFEQTNSLELSGRLGDFTASYDSGLEQTSSCQKESSFSEGMRFRILRPHAKGGLGEVSIALDEELQREVALKQIQGQYTASQTSRKRFTLEAEITGKLEHPGIVPVYGFGMDAMGNPYYAMRFIRGVSLSAELKRYHESASSNHLDLRRILARFIDVCNAIEFAHSRGVLHRDIKPSNIMLGSYGETLVVDWGLAKAGGQHDSHNDSPEATLRPSGSGPAPTELGRAMGTPAYMSPEQARGSLDEICPATDVYSLGATLYSILTGAKAFNGSNQGIILRKVERGTFTPPREIDQSIPRPLEAICLKAMSLNITDRYTTPTELAEELERWLGDEPVTAFQEPFLTRAGRWLRRHRTVTSGIVAGMVVGFMSFGIGLALVSLKNAQILHQKQLAENRFDLALDAIEEYYTGVSEDVLLKQEGLSALRTRLLRTPLEFYERLRVELGKDTDPRFKIALCSAYIGIADITKQVGSREAAIVEYEGAIQLLQSLLETDPDNHMYGRMLAACYNNIGLIQRETNDLENALVSFRKSIDLSTGLKEHEMDVKQVLAASYMNLGRLQQTRGEHDHALASCQMAIDILQDLTSRNASTENQKSLATVYNNISNLYAQTGGLKSAVSFSKKSLDLRSVLARDNRAEFQFDLAQSYVNFGNLHAYLLGEREEAIKYFQVSLTIQERLCNEYPIVTPYQSQLAGIYYSLGNIVHDQEEAVAHYETALEIRKKLVMENPGVSRFQNDLASSYSGLAHFNFRQGRVDRAIVLCQDSIQVLIGLVADSPNVIEFESALASKYNDLGGYEYSAKRPNKSREAWDKSIKIRERLMNNYPKVTTYAVDFGGTCSNWANLIAESGEFGSSLEWYTKAIRILEVVLAENPSNQNARTFLSNAYRGRMDVFTRLGQRKDASEDWDRLVALTPAHRHPQLQMARATSEALMGEHQRATEWANELAESAKVSGQALFEASCVFSVSSNSVIRDVTLEEEKRNELAKQYSKRAIQLLKMAADVGFFRKAPNLTMLKRDPMLDAIRTSAGFKNMLKQTEIVDQ